MSFPGIAGLTENPRLASTLFSAVAFQARLGMIDDAVARIRSRFPRILWADDLKQMTQARMNRGAEPALPSRIPSFLFHPVWVRSRFGGYRGLARLMLAWGELIIGRHRRWKRVRWESVTRIVFVCHGNICRSPYAERRAASHGLPAASFGLSAECGAPADPVALRIAAQRGIPLAEHKARDVKEFDFRSGDLLVAMEPRQARAMSAASPPVPCQLTLLGLWSRPSRPHIHDPHRLSEAYWGRCFNVIDSAVLTIANRMRRAGR